MERCGLFASPSPDHRTTLCTLDTRKTSRQMSAPGHFRPSSAGFACRPFRFAPRADIPPAPAFMSTRPTSSIDGDADGADHLAPIGDLALEIRHGLGLVLHHRIEPDRLEPLQHVSVLHDLVDLGI